jgi:hypothetical protein
LRNKNGSRPGRDELLLIRGRFDDLSFFQKLDEWKFVVAVSLDERELIPIVP